ncbi:NAD(P)-binding protein [Mycena pura]|uniref:NAD(P)-binding protein n=1 Tax=Mycena pura TaxID=153505 RepID=A0AAD6YIC9_9AGAR|nr:NAD(P)-binding protein [Mycena pura]
MKRTVLITGCGPGGIGFELAKEFQAKGVSSIHVARHANLISLDWRGAGLRVFASARRPEALAELAAAGLETVVLDVAQAASVRAAREHVASMTGGTLDILVNNAGMSYSVPATDVNMDEVHDLFEANLFGVMRMVQEFSPLLIASGDGRIVNIGSIAGVMPYPFGSAYNASKAALHAYGNTLRLELAPFNVQVTTILTGGVKSRIARTPRLIQPSSIYAPIAEHFAKHRAARSQVGAMPTDAYARTVVAQTLRRRVKAWVWTGNFSFVCWFIDTFLGRTGFDWLFSRAFGLTKLKSMILKDKLKKDV